jgi:hypothetical protein
MHSNGAGILSLECRQQARAPLTPQRVARGTLLRRLRVLYSKAVSGAMRL